MKEDIMSKNDKTLSVGEIEQKKKDLQSDLDKVQSQLQNSDNMKV
jgi:uncharacterized small protein (DUF1192 family)